MQQEEAFVGPFLQMSVPADSKPPSIQTAQWSALTNCLQMLTEATKSVPNYVCIRLKVKSSNAFYVFTFENAILFRFNTPFHTNRTILLCDKFQT